MKRLTISVVASTAFAVVAVAQNAATMSPYRSMPAPRGATPYGNILFPGGTPSHAQALGAAVAGVPYPGIGYGGVGSGGHGRGGRGGGRNRTIVIPYAVPVWSGGYNGYLPQEPEQPSVTVVMPQQPTPSVIINNHYASDGKPISTTVESASDRSLKVYEGTPREAPAATAPTATAPAVTPVPAGSLVRDDKPNIYMIALKDGTVRQAIGYWTKDGALHYVTPQATISHIGLEMVDRSATGRLNADRKLDWELPIE
jgi:hypothetical protein